jgi:DNA-binding transcriptional MerR regulator/catechol 2,3-dioxygenase-like lactoylglutathione lyase family enzyme
VDDGLLPIGRFASLTGLSIHALRHYDDVGLLHPADVDAASGYRRYSRDQIDSAKLIRRLRWLGMPIDEIREAVRGDNTTVAAAIATHRSRLEREMSLLNDRIAATDPPHERRNSMPASAPACRPVQIKITVADAPSATKFYETVFGIQPQVTRRTEDEDFYGFTFGRYDEPDFFLLHLISDESDMDHTGPATFGMQVDDLDQVHRRALDAGAVETVAPVSPEGMPRCSAVRDPDGNWIWLYQG